MFTGFDYPHFIQTAYVEHILGHVYGDRQLELTAQNLVTASLDLTQWHSGEGVKPNLPSLRHLRIDYRQYTECFSEAITPFLQQVGDQLGSLYIDSPGRDQQMPVDIWELCPNLEKFHPGLVLPVSPPMSHPLHTLSLLPRHLWFADTLQYPNLRRLIFDGYWREIDWWGVTHLVSIQTTSLIDRVTVEDLNGTPLADALEDPDIWILKSTEN